MDSPWCAGMAQCLQCSHEWVAVWPLGADPLTCPACASMDTVRDSAPSRDKD